jgi:hypothetical protein
MNWEAYAWIAWLASFAVLEAIGLARRADAMTLTFFIEHHCPRWFLAALLGWLTYHFLVAAPAKG